MARLLCFLPRKPTCHQSQHGDFSAQKTWTSLRATTENALKEFVKCHARCTTQDLGTWLKNHRKLNTERKCKWIQSFRSQMQHEYGTMEELVQAPPAEWPSVLKFGDFSFDAKETCLTLCNPTLLHETLSRLSSRNTSSCAATGLLDLPPKSGSF